MDKNNLSTEALVEIASIMRNYLNGIISPINYDYGDFITFSYHSDIISDVIMFSYYPEQETFHGNVNNGGSFTGNLSTNYIFITCSQTSNSTTITF